MFDEESAWGEVEEEVGGFEVDCWGYFGGGGRRYSNVWERIMFWSCGERLVFFVAGKWVRGVNKGGENGMGIERGFTESVHLNSPRNMRVSVVVIRRFFPRREVRYDSALALDCCAIFIVFDFGVKPIDSSRQLDDSSVNA